MSHHVRSRSPRWPVLQVACVLFASWCAPGLAFAHHGMGGKLPSTFFQGFASGLAHPVIGLDHLAAVLLVGAFCGALRRGLAPVIAFVSTTLLGCLVHGMRYDLPRSETWLALSVIALGVVACSALHPRRAPTLLLFAACGALHGYAYGESIVGAESTPLAAYLLGFSLVQFALASAALWLAQRLSSSAPANQLTLVRVLGAASILTGIGALI